MSTKALLEQLVDANISIGLVDGQLNLLDPDGNLTEALINEIRAQKQALIEWLEQEQVQEPKLDPYDFPLARVDEQTLAEIEKEHRDIDQLYIATPLQTGLIFHGLVDGQGADYTSLTFCDLVGVVDVDAIIEAWQHVVNRHDILRTCFVGLASEQVHQLVKKQVELEFNQLDWRNKTTEQQQKDLAEYRANDKKRGFDFAVAPLVRFSLIRIADDRYHFIWTHHHVLIDGWCTPIVFGEVLHCYRLLEAGRSVALPSVNGYKNYISWLTRRDETAANQFWQDYLAGFDAPTPLIVDKMPNRNTDKGYGAKGFRLSEALSDKLDALAGHCQCTMNVIAQAAWAILLHRYTGESDVVFGTTVSGRPADLPRVDKMVGLFINTIPARVQFNDDLTVSQLLKDIHTGNLNRDEYCYFSLAQIQKHSSLPSGTTLFDSLLTFQNYPAEQLIENESGKSDGLKIEAVSGAESSNYGLDLTVLYQKQVVVELRYWAEKIGHQAIEGMLGHYEQILCAMAEMLDAKGEASIASISLLSEAEQQQFARWNDTRVALPAYQNIHQWFAVQAAKTPDNTAIMDKKGALSYQQLAKQSDQWAGFLFEQGVKPNQVVGVYLERSAQLAVAMLAVAKAGAAFVLLDTDYPASRLQYMLDNSQAEIVLSDSQRVADLVDININKIAMDETDVSNIVFDAQAVEVSGENTACVFYTSGSTGQPKGAIFSHNNLLNYTQAMIKVLEMNPSDRTLQMASVSFDVVLEELLPTLLSGASVVIHDDGGLLGAVELQQLLSDKAISVVEISFAQWREWLYWLDANQQKPSSSLRRVMVGCESISATLMKQWQQYDIALVHVYGLTETTVTTTTWDSRSFDGDMSRVMPAGSPIDNTQLYVLDKHQNRQPVGVEGELYVGGAGVSPGYLHQPELTEQRFVRNPFTADCDDMLYRTGDMVRWLDNGNIEFVGRADDQIKIRGFRVELGEIEAALSGCEAVKESVVLALTSMGSDKRLVAYVVPSPNSQQSDGDSQTDLIAVYRRHLGKSLPDYMIPAHFILLDALPLTLAGKIDKKALPAPGLDNLQTEQFVAPTTELESQLCDIWASALGLDAVGINDNFFEIGGDSIVSIQVASRATQAGIALTVKQLFEHQTVAAIVAELDHSEQVQASQEALRGQQTLLPIHHWFFEEKTLCPNHDNMAVLLKLPQDCDATFIEQWIDALYQRHDALRLTFVKAKNSSSQWQAHFDGDLNQQSNNVIERFDLSGLENEQYESAIAEHGLTLQTSLSLTEGRLVKIGYFDADDNDKRRLLVIIHHSVVDGVSWRVIGDDLNLAWQQYQQQQPIELPAKTSSVQQWGDTLTRFRQSEEFARELDYWRESLAIEVEPLKVDKTESQPALQADNDTVLVSLSTERTEQLLRDCPATYRTQINELLLSAIWLAFNRWLGQSGVRIWMEGHGRQSIGEGFDKGIDLTQTVGWFTTMYPLTLHCDSDELSDVITTIKEQYRALPNSGLGYGVGRYLTKDPALQSDDVMDITFNYLGQLDQSLDTEGPFPPASEFTGVQAHDENPRESTLSIGARVVDAVLKVNIGFGGNQYHKRSIETLGQHLEQALVDVIEQCLTRDAQRLTPSDFPLASVNQAQLDQWQQRFNAIENVYNTVPMQQGMLFHCLLEQDNSAYLAQMVSTISGNLDTDTLRQAWQMLIKRHSVFRTLFIGMNGEQIQQVVMDDATLPWFEHDWSQMSQSQQTESFKNLKRQDQQQGFTLESAPLMRMNVVKLADNRYQILWSYFMGLFDGWSLPLVNGELFNCYRALSQSRAPVLPNIAPYHQYVAWLNKQDANQAKAFWQSHLQGFSTPTAIGIDKMPVNPAQSGVAELEHELPKSVADNLQKLAKSTQSTMNVIVQAAWSYLLHRYSGEHDVVFGTTVSGRPAGVVGVEQMLGLFINTIPARVRFDSMQTLGSLLRTLHQDNISRDEYSYLPLADIQQASDLPRGEAMFDSYLVFQNYPVETAIKNQNDNHNELRFEVETTDAKSGYALDVSATYQETLSIKIEYRRETFADETIKRVFEHLEQIMTSMANGQSDLLVGDINMLSDAERQQVMEDWNATESDYPADCGWHELFAQQAARTPENVAVVYQQQNLNYAELDALSNQWAHYIRSHNLPSDAVVGVYLERSVSLCVAMLAVMKAGATFVLLDTDYPLSRLHFMIKDSRLAWLLTDSSLENICAAEQGNMQPVTRWCMDQIGVSEQPVDMPAVAAAQNACVFYTSGSTGNPKGAVYSHQNLNNYATAMKAVLDCQPTDRTLQMASVSFDVILEEMLPGWLTGSTVVINSQNGLLGAEEIHQLVEQQQISCIEISYAQWREWLYWLKANHLEPSDCLRVIMVGCESIRPEPMAQWAQYGISLVHVYGLTETSITSSIWHSDQYQGDMTRVMPAGRPLANTRFYVLDEQQRVQPVGVAGELYIGGAGVVKGYLGQPALTAQRFVQNPYSPLSTDILYRTGDKVRWLPDGNIEFIGREDAQVKIRGFRVELGEVESALAKLDYVNDAVVIARTNDNGDKQLAAYIAVDEDKSAQAASEKVKQALGAFLPGYMVPTYVIALEQLPLTLSGKVDKKALPAPGDMIQDSAQYRAPRNPMEQQLCDIWAQALGLEQVSIDDNFFELGGDSIISIQVASRATQEGINLKVRELFEYPSIAQLSQQLGSGVEIDAPQGPVEGEQVLLPIHHWFFANKKANVDHNNMAVLLVPPSALNEEFLRAWIEVMYQRHDVLRLCFEHHSGNPAANKAYYLGPNAQLTKQVLEVIDMAGFDDKQRLECIATEGERLQQSLSLADGQLMRVGYFKTGKSNEDDRVLVVIHHSVVDGVSLRIIQQDLEQSYEQYCQKGSVDMAAKSSSYQSFARSLSEYAKAPEFADQKDYWQNALAQPVMALPVDEWLDSESDELSAVKIGLNAQKTEQLLRDCSKAYNTRINELLLSAVYLGVKRWSRIKTGQGRDEAGVRIWLEGHGREELFEQLDLNQTMGWFTTLYPLTLNAAESNSIATVIKAVKEQNRALPNNGIGYGLSRYFAESQEQVHSDEPDMDIMFNYLGQMGQDTAHTSAFGFAGEYAGRVSAAGDAAEAKLVIDGMVAGGRLAFELRFEQRQYRSQTMEALASNIEQALLEIIDHCASAQSVCLTPSDFPLAQTTQAQLDLWQQRYDNIENIYATVPMQQGMLFHRLLADDKSAYMGQIGYTINGPLNLRALHDSWQVLIDRHAAFRTLFVGMESEHIQQLVLTGAQLPWTELDWRELNEQQQAQAFKKLCAEDKAQGFDFEKAPLTRMTVIRLNDHSHRVLWSYFMGLFDGWSVPAINNELFSLYRAKVAGTDAQLPEVAPPLDYIQWLADQNKQQALDFWADHMHGISEPTPLVVNQLPIEGPDDERPVSRHKTASLNAKHTEQLVELARQTQTTMNVIVQAAWGYLLHRYSGEQDVVFGTTVSGRPGDLVGVDKMVGLFINNIPARLHLPNKQNLACFLQAVHADNVRREDYSYISLLEIQGLSEVKQGQSLFESYLVFQNYPLEDIDGQLNKGGQVSEQRQSDSQQLTFVDAMSDEASNYKLMLQVVHQNELNYALKYNPELMSEQAIDSMMRHLGQILTSMATGGQSMALGDIALMDTAECEQLLVQYNQTQGDYPQASSITSLFEQQVIANGDETALVCGGDNLTFEELNHKANQLAHELRARGVSSGDLVGLCINRSVDMMVALLAVLKAGGAYVPLDPEFPAARLSYIAKDSGFDLVLTQKQWLEQLPFEGVDLLCLDDAEQQQKLVANPAENLNLPSTPDALVYVIYTSGTTGQPKGVMIEQQGVLNYLSHVNNAYMADIEGSVVSLPLIFDATVTTLMAPLCFGKFVELLPHNEDLIEQLQDYLFDDEEPLLFKLTPAHLDALAASDVQSNVDAEHVVVIGGEQLTCNTMRQWQNYLPNCTFINEYGPTETVVGCSTFVVDKHTNLDVQGLEAVPIGKPILNTQLYVLDQHRQNVPMGVIGELYIGGAGLARGYLNQPQLTQKSFIELDVQSEKTPLYKTGDSVRWLPDGNLQYVGRIDEQVKLRGFRIELGDIQSTLVSLDGVQQAVAMVREDEGVDKRLVAYVVDDKPVEAQDQSWQSARIAEYQAHLSEYLPSYMVPAIYVFLNELKLTRNGKVDRKALPAPEAADLQKDQYVAPQNKLESQLCEIWQDILKIEKVGINDHFFALGGDSILSIQVVSKAKQLGMHFTVRQLFDYPTISQLVPMIECQSSIEAPQEAIVADLPLLPIQRHFFEQKLKVPNHYNQSVMLKTPETFNPEFLTLMVKAWYQRHDALRLRFDESNTATAKHQPFEATMVTESVDCYDISDLSSERQTEQLLHLTEKAQSALDIRQGPLLKAVYADLGEQGGRLFLAIHHLVVDGVSWRILLADLELAWTQYSSRQEVKLAEKSSSLAQWGEALVDYGNSPAVENQRAYWLSQMALPVSPIPQATGPITAVSEGIQGAKFSLNEDYTQLLLTQCNDAYRTKINELLLAALLRAYQQWATTQTLCLRVEGHGREALFDHLDCGETLGWFTSVYPLILSQDEHADLSDLITTVKEQCRQVPDNGLGFGVLKYVKQDTELLSLSESVSRPDIEFNYLGQFDGSVNEQTAFTMAGEKRGADVADDNDSDVGMSINGMVHEGKLSFSVTASAESLDVQLLCQHFKASLMACIDHCVQTNQDKALFEQFASQDQDSLADLAEDGIEI